jgi:hypothetical protein
MKLRSFVINQEIIKVFIFRQLIKTEAWLNCFIQLAAYFNGDTDTIALILKRYHPRSFRSKLSHAIF